MSFNEEYFTTKYSSPNLNPRNYVTFNQMDFIGIFRIIAVYY
jgi:hypothetical protein